MLTLKVKCMLLKSLILTANRLIMVTDAPANKNYVLRLIPCTAKLRKLLVLRIQTKAQQIFDLRTAVCAFCLRIVNLKQRVTIMVTRRVTIKGFALACLSFFCFYVVKTKTSMHAWALLLYPKGRLTFALEMST